jgi:quercetin dioxygenase-like cupin family protein
MEVAPVLRITLFLSFTLLLFACATSSKVAVDKPAPALAAAEAPVETPATSKNVLFAEIPFKAFNPEKPDGPHIYPFSGNPKAGAFSAIVKLPPGFTTPLHTHKEGYSGVSVSEGCTHGASMETIQTLPKGSAWYQPGSEPHVDGCAGEAPCYFLVFFEGAVDMTPAEAPAAEPKAVVMPANELQWKELKGGVKMAVIHGNPKEGAFQALIDFPAGMTTNVHTHTAAFSGALVSGTHQRGPSPDALLTLTEGSVWSEPSNAPHMEKCGDQSRCILAVSMDGPLDTKNVELTPAAAE